MSNPRPVFQREGPTNPCILLGQDLSWKNCTTLSAAMGMDKSTFGQTRMTGCQVRKETNDVTGGTTIPQAAAVCAKHGIAVEVHVGGNVAQFQYFLYQSQNGRGVLLQGNTSADGRGNVNHAVWLNESIGGTPGYPTSSLVYDPWSTGPQWWSSARVKAFSLALRPYGEADSRTLGSLGIIGAYCGIFPDTDVPIAATYQLHIAKGAVIRKYDMQKAQPINCIKSWHDEPWGRSGSHVVCTKPSRRVTCDGRSGALVTKVLGGYLLKDEWVRVSTAHGTSITYGS